MFFLHLNDVFVVFQKKFCRNIEMPNLNVQCVIKKWSSFLKVRFQFLAHHLFWGHLHFWSHLHFWIPLKSLVCQQVESHALFWGCLPFCGCPHFEVAVSSLIHFSYPMQYARYINGHYMRWEMISSCSC